MKKRFFEHPGKGIFFLFLLAGLFPAFVNVKAQHIITGTVTDDRTGALLSGAHVLLIKTAFSAVSDETGSFSLGPLKKGTYTLKISFVGYKTYQSLVRINGDTLIRASLNGEALLGEEVNIIATRVQYKMPAAFSSLSAKEIQAVNLGRDIPYMIQGTPSAIVTSDAGNGIGYTGFSIRGTDLTRINVTVNSIPLNEAESQGVWFVDLPDLASSTGDVQIQRGVGTSTNGAGAFGASINFLTTDLHQDPYGELDVSGGSNRTLKSTLRFGSGLIGDRFSFDGRFSYIHSDGYIDRAFSNLKSYYLSAGYYGNKTTLRIITFSGLEHTYQAWEGVPKDSLATNRTYNPAGEYHDAAGNLAYYDNQTDNYQQDHYQLIFSQLITKSWNLNLALHYTKGKGYYENYKEDQSFANYGLENVIIGGDTLFSTDLVNRKMMDNDFYGFTFSTNYNVTDNLKLNLGGAWNHYFGRHFGKVIWATFASNGTNDRNYYYNTGHKYDFNIFAKATWTLQKWLTLFGDLQYRNVHYQMEGISDNLRILDQSHVFNFFNPKAGIFFEWKKKHEAWLSFGIANREPSRNNYKDADPGKVPINETLYDFEAGYQFKPGILLLNVNAYYMYYTNQLILTGKINNVGEAVMVNVPKSYRAGIEFSGGVDLFRKKLNVTAGFTLSRNKINDFTQFVDVYDADWNFMRQDSVFLGETNLSFSPAIISGLSVTWHPVANFTTTINFKYIGPQYIDNTGNSERSLDGYLTSGFTAQYTIKTSFFKEISFKLNLNNFLNRKYETNAWVYPYYVDNQYYEANGYFPQALINVLFGITIRI